MTMEKCTWLPAATENLSDPCEFAKAFLACSASAFDWASRALNSHISTLTAFGFNSLLASLDPSALHKRPARDCFFFSSCSHLVSLRRYQDCFVFHALIRGDSFVIRHTIRHAENLNLHLQGLGRDSCLFSPHHKWNNHVQGMCTSKHQKGCLGVLWALFLQTETQAKQILCRSNPAGLALCGILAVSDLAGSHSMYNFFLLCEAQAKLYVYLNLTCQVS